MSCYIAPTLQSSYGICSPVELPCGVRKSPAVSDSQIMPELYHAFQDLEHLSLKTGVGYIGIDAPSTEEGLSNLLRVSSMVKEWVVLASKIKKARRRQEYRSLLSLVK